MSLRTNAVWLLIALIAPACAQERVRQSRLAEAEQYLRPRPQEPSLRCEVHPLPAMLDFSMRFQAGYFVSVPIQQYEGEGHRWGMVTRITPEGGDGKPVYLASFRHLPVIPKVKADLTISGGFLLGQGSYKVDWVLMDDQERVCRKSWHLNAPAKNPEGINPPMKPYTADSLSSFRWKPAKPEDGTHPLRLTVLLHAAPLMRAMTRVRERDQSRLLGSLGTLLEQTPAESVRVVAFNLDQQREIFRSDDFTPREFPRLARAVQDLELGLVDYQVLKNRTGSIDLLSDLLSREAAEKRQSDAVIFLGPAGRAAQRLPPDVAEEHMIPGVRWFYFEYRSYRDRGSDFPDTIQNLVKKLGGQTFKIYTPGEFAKAVGRLK